MPMPKIATLISPYGEKLVNLMVPAEKIEELKAYAGRLPSLQLTERSKCDLELLATGAFSPVDSFMGQEDYHQALDNMRLANGYIFPVPITLPVEPGPDICLGQDIALRNDKYELLAIMAIEEIYKWDWREEAQKVLGTQNPHHPLVAEMAQWGSLNISGRLQVFQLPYYYDFNDLRLTPTQTRARLKTCGYTNIIAFQPYQPLHYAYEEFTRQIMRELDGMLLLHPSVGMARPGHIGYYSRIQTYRAVVQQYYNPGRVLLSIFPLATRMAGIREVIWQLLIQRNYGANYLIVNQHDHNPNLDITDRLSHYSANGLEQYSRELQVKMISFKTPLYTSTGQQLKETPATTGALQSTPLSEKQIQNKFLDNGQLLPEWFTRPEVARILAKAHPPKHRQGVCIWFTGLSGSGKSTTAEALTVLLLEHDRQVTVLDGDVVRTHLSKGLGFSKEDRDTNIRRIGFVAAELVRHGGTVICAAVSPYRTTRNDVRNMVGPDHFIEVFVDTPLSVCEARDVKGLYAKARRGEINDFTGIDDPYEPPLQAEVVLDTVAHTPEENAQLILDYLIGQGFVQ